MQKLKMMHKEQDWDAIIAKMPTVRATKSELAAIKKYYKEKAAGTLKLTPLDDFLRESEARRANARRRAH